MNKKPVDIIIVTFNAIDKLRGCLESIERHTKNTSYALTIVNNSSDGTLHFLKHYQKKNKNIKIIDLNKNLGFCGAANLALRNTHNKFIVRLDDDAEVTEGWLDKLYKQIKNKPKVGIVGCKIVFPDNKIHCADYRVRPLQIVGHGEKDKGQRDYIKECDALAGPCWLIKRKIIEKVGYFDEEFFPCQAEDIDYCLRVRLAGYKIIYNGQVKMIHHHLYRDGGQSRKNLNKFLKKWKKLLYRFPLKDSHPVDKYIAKGTTYLKKKKFKQALIEFEKAESIDERFAEPFYIGIALEGMGKYHEAIHQFKKVLSLNPLNLQVHHNLIIIYKKMGLEKEAKRESIKTLGLFSSCKNKYFRN